MTSTSSILYYFLEVFIPKSLTMMLSRAVVVVDTATTVVVVDAVVVIFAAAVARVADNRPSITPWNAAERK